MRHDTDASIVNRKYRAQGALFILACIVIGLVLAVIVILGRHREAERAPVSPNPVGENQLVAINAERPVEDVQPQAETVDAVPVPQDLSSPPGSAVPALFQGRWAETLSDCQGNAARITERAFIGTEQSDEVMEVRPLGGGIVYVALQPPSVMHSISYHWQMLDRDHLRMSLLDEDDSPSETWVLVRCPGR